MNGGGNVNMDPDTRPIKAQVGSNEEASTGALGVLTVLSKYNKSITDLRNTKTNIVLEILS